MQLRSLVPCPACQGRGFAISQTCRGCAGHGMRRQRRRLHIRVPPGVDEGSVLRLQGCGDAGQGGAPAGDVHVRFEVRPALLGGLLRDCIGQFELTQDSNPWVVMTK